MHKVLKNPLFWIGAGLFLELFIPAAYITWNFHKAWHYDNAYAKIVPGDSEQRVVELMGKPSGNDYDLPLPDTWDGETTSNRRNEVTSQTVKVYWYGVTMVAQHYAIGFDNHGRAVTKYNYSSP